MKVAIKVYAAISPSFADDLIPTVDTIGFNQ